MPAADTLTLFLLEATSPIIGLRVRQQHLRGVTGRSNKGALLQTQSTAVNGNPWHVYALLMAPVIYLVGAWMLNVACRICSVEQPGFWRALAVVVASAVAGTGVINALGLQEGAHWGVQFLLGLCVACGLVCFMLRMTLANAIRVVLLECVMTLGITLGLMAAAVVLDTQLNIGQLRVDRHPDAPIPFGPPPTTFVVAPPDDR